MPTESCEIVPQASADSLVTLAARALERVRDGAIVGLGSGRAATAFVRTSTEKGRLTELMRTIEVRVALNPDAPLIGAAQYGRRLAS